MTDSLNPRVNADGSAASSGNVDTTGDAIMANIGVGATNVAVGKQITQVIGFSAAEVEALIVKIRTSTQPSTWDGRTPYLGLATFQSTDAEFFFGREKLVEELLLRVQQTRFVCVAGPSGSGKSSLVQAGLIYALQHAKIPSGDKWLSVTLRPLGDPIEQLAQAMARLAKTPIAAEYLHQQGQTNPSALHAQAETLLGNDARQRLIIYVDQFEELFTQTKQEELRRAFLTLLTTAAQHPSGRVTVIVALRADFVAQCATYPELRNLISQQFQLVGALAPEELARAIVLPALWVGAEVEPKLVEQLIADMQGEPGALPLLQFALKDLFDAQSPRKGAVVKLTLADYLQRGGIRQALERHAEAIFNQFTEQQQHLAQHIFTRLIEVGRGAMDTRRTAAFAELLTVDTTANQVDVVVQMLAQARLLIIDDPQPVLADASLITLPRQDHNSQFSTCTVTIAHEKLIDAWPWLRRLVNENRDTIDLQNKVSEDAQTWMANHGDASYLYSGVRLAVMEEKLIGRQVALDSLTRSFIDVARQEEAARHQQSEAAYQRELEQARALAQEAEARRYAESQRAQEAEARERIQIQSVKRLRLRNLWLTIAGIVALTLAVIAGTLYTRAGRQVTVNQSLALAAGSQQALTNHNVDLAIALALQANHIDQPPLAARNALAAAAYIPGTRRIFTGHQGAVYAVAFSPDETKAISGGQDKSLILWDLETDQLPLRFIGHAGAVTSVAYSPDGQTVLSGSEDHSIILWNATTGQLLYRFEAHTASVNGVVFLPDEKHALSGSFDSTLILWDLMSREVISRVVLPDCKISALDVNHSDGHTASVGCDDGTVRIRNLETGKSNSIGGKLAFPLQKIALSPDGVKVAFGGGTSVQIWDTIYGSTLRNLNEHTQRVVAVTFSPDGHTLLSGANDASLVLWDVEFAAPIYRFVGHRATVFDLAISRDGTHALSASGDGTVRLWDLYPPSQSYTLRDHTDRVRKVVISRNGRMAFSGSEDGTLRIWDLQRNQILKTIDFKKKKIRSKEVMSIAITNDGKRGLVGTYMELSYWDLEKNSLLYALDEHADPVLAVALTPDERTALSASSDKQVIVWDLERGVEMRRFIGHQALVWCVAISSDGKMAVSGDENGMMILWDIATATPIHVLIGHDDAVYAVAFGPDGRTIMSGSADHSLILWNVATGTRLRRFEGHSHPVRDVIYSPDGKTILSASEDKSIRLWDVSSGIELFQFNGHASDVWSIAYDPSSQGSKFISSSKDRSLILWRMPFFLLEQDSWQKLIDWTDTKRYIHNFSCEERVRYTLGSLCQ